LRSTDDQLSFDVVVASAGARFKSYGAAVGRTYLVNPSSKQKKAYQSLLDVQQLVIDNLKPGERVRAVVSA
jgi:nucleosome binding factor SPN SPT16 subunit